MREAVEPDSVGTEVVGRDFHATPTGRVGSAFMSFGLAGLSAFMGSVLLGRGEIIGAAFVAVALWSGWAGMRWLYRLRSREPAVSLTADGIVDRISLGGDVFIPWSAVTAVSGDDSVMEIHLRPESEVRVPMGRRLLGWSRQRPASVYVLPTRLLDTHAYAVHAFTREWHESLVLEDVREGRLRGNDAAGLHHPGLGGESPGVRRVTKELGDE